MPIVSSKYKYKPWYFFNNHLETVIPAVFFDCGPSNYVRERLELADGDFLDLDWMQNNNSKLIILSHGLEGNSERNYIRRPAKYFSERNFDILAWNCRSCSGEMNRLPKLYHHGSSDDLSEVIQHVTAQNKYPEIILAGYSMGGSINLKYLSTEVLPKEIKGSVNFSTPCDLLESTKLVSAKGNEIYSNKFLQRLGKKAVALAEEKMPELNVDALKTVKTFEEFHKYFTIPVMGIHNMDEFYEMASCDNFLPNLKVKSLLVNAANDPMLGLGCSPQHIANKNKNLYLEVSRHGGHLGFSLPHSQKSYMEQRMDLFIKEIILS